MGNMVRKIIHVDMDAFYASVEQRDDPTLRGKPVVVGGNPQGRGVVATCSYEARKFGIHSAMASARAVRLCPQVVFVRPRFTIYRALSRQIRGIFSEYTDLIEPLSLDEAFLDVTTNKRGMRSATHIAQEILERIKDETKLSASAGVSFNKFLAKVASDEDKPGGLTVITPEYASAFIDQLPIRRFFGVGKVTESRMFSQGIYTGYDLKKCTRVWLQSFFGKSGGYYYDIAHEDDQRPVQPSRGRKSVGKETTLAEDTHDSNALQDILNQLAGEVAEVLKKNNIKGKTITLKVKYHDFRTITRSISLEKNIDERESIYKYASSLMQKTEVGSEKVRLLGVTVSHLDTESSMWRNPQQLTLEL